MAQATSAQREPSMEEILASIRRIIEDSDTGRKPGDVAPPEANLPEQSFVSRLDASVIEVDAFRSELRSRPEVAALPQTPVQSAAPTPEFRKPRTLAEVQAEVARSMPRPSIDGYGAPKVAGDPVAEPPVFTATPAAETTPEPSPEAKAEIEAPIVRAPTAVEFANLGSAVIPPAPKEQTPSPIAPMVDADDDVEPVAVETRPMRDEAPRSAILSERTGRQVAAAFGELSEVFAESRKKSFDEMAEKMIRPMLQEWLDNNLPTLVERLVREEIERVARGA